MRYVDLILTLLSVAYFNPSSQKWSTLTITIFYLLTAHFREMVATYPKQLADLKVSQTSQSIIYALLWRIWSNNTRHSFKKKKNNMEPYAKCDRSRKTSHLVWQYSIISSLLSQETKLVNNYPINLYMFWIRTMNVSCLR